ncbi:MAG: hypothetical protein L0Y64_19535 [Myxococcaceae bacterium]|nr:hypothetical protein [Myxococcaceae bacterium]
MTAALFLEALSDMAPDAREELLAHARQQDEGGALPLAFTLGVLLEGQARTGS